MRRRVTLDFDANEVEYHMLLTQVMRQLQRGQTRGEVFVGSGRCFYKVETDHSQAPEPEQC